MNDWNQCWQVLKTFLYRPRMWLFSGVYLYGLWNLPEGKLRTDDVTIARWEWNLLMVCVYGAIVGLQLRRQFSGASVHVVPGFARPHAIFTAIMSVVLWGVIPGLCALWVGRPVWPTIGACAVAGIVMSLVAIEPKTLFLVLAAPVVAILWIQNTNSPEAIEAQISLHQLAYWNSPLGVAIALALEIGSVTAALVWLGRATNRGNVANDDIELGFSGLDAQDSFIRHPFAALRDRAIERQLKQRMSRVGRWRLPGAVSWQTFAAILGMILSVGLFCVLFVPSLFGLSIVLTPLLVFTPLSTWSVRCKSMAVESLRPVSRTQFIRQYMAAMAADFGWCAMTACLLLVAIDLVLYWETIFGAQAIPSMLTRFVIVAGAGCLVIWHLAAILLAASLATLRLKYYIPVLAVAYVAGITAWFSSLLTTTQFLHSHFDIPMGEAINSSNLHVVAAALIAADALPLAVVAFVIWLVYRRWLRMDLT